MWVPIIDRNLFWVLNPVNFGLGPPENRRTRYPFAPLDEFDCISVDDILHNWEAPFLAVARILPGLWFRSLLGRVS